MNLSLAGNRKRKMSEQTLSSPKNCILCPPEVKRNKRGETPLHVAAIKVHCDKTDSVKKLGISDLVFVEEGNSENKS